jgi:hypothetical protein
VSDTSCTADRELDEILWNRGSSEECGRKRLQRRQKDDCVTRRAVTTEDMCPICYDDIHQTDLLHLTWCRNGCGQNIHGKCMQVWMNHNKQKSQASDADMRAMHLCAINLRTLAAACAHGHCKVPSCGAKCAAGAQMSNVPL